jgi:hypothetical protein
LLAHGELVEASASWVLMPHHAGTPLVDGQPVPDGAYEILARVHARYLGEQVPGLPVVDAAFWRRLCLDVALPAVRGAARRSASGGVASGAVAPGVASGGVAPGVASGGVASGDDPGRSDPPERDQKLYGEAEERLLVWSSDDRMLSALSLLPATLAHGDLHRGNILANIRPLGNPLTDPTAEQTLQLPRQGHALQRRDGKPDLWAPSYLTQAAPLHDQVSFELDPVVKLADLGAAFFEDQPPTTVVTSVALRAPEIILGGGSLTLSAKGQTSGRLGVLCLSCLPAALCLPG